MEQLYKVFVDSNGVSIDSRTIQKGQIYFAIKGDRFDGHQFVDEVIEKGASLAVVHDEKYLRGDKTLLVTDTLRSLQDLAHHHRMQFNTPVLGITGSNGKTTTKELIHAVLSRKYKVHTTGGNFNNHIGVPLTLLSAELDNDILIIEMGANRLKDIDELCRIASPNYGLITNIGLAHIEGFGSYENIIVGKTELYRYIDSNGGYIFYNDEDKVLHKNLPKHTECIPYMVDDIEFKYQQPTLAFEDTEMNETYETKLFGMYNETNIEAAITLGRYFRVLDEEIFDAIRSYIPSMNRSQITKYAGVTFIKDAYNANPNSMKLSIKSMMNYATPHKCLVLGDMKELGDESINLHKEILTYLSDYQWTKVVLVGSLFTAANEDFGYVSYNNANDLKEDMSKLLSEWNNCTVLLKGSRSMQLESIIES
jgi:UDP-N-acetylmuramoyl-tripeptide--D-alanyl-D-alanine ligase